MDQYDWDTLLNEREIYRAIGFEEGIDFGKYQLALELYRMVMEQEPPMLCNVEEEIKQQMAKICRGKVK